VLLQGWSVLQFEGVRRTCGPINWAVVAMRSRVIAESVMGGLRSMPDHASLVPGLVWACVRRLRNHRHHQILLDFFSLMPRDMPGGW
jgi:hypothetical protein